MIVTGRSPDKGKQCAGYDVVVASTLRQRMLLLRMSNRLHMFALPADRAVERFKHDIPGAQAEYMRMDLADFGYALEVSHNKLVLSSCCTVMQQCTSGLRTQNARSRRQVRSFAAQINSSGMPLHILVNNAGLGAVPRMPDVIKFRNEFIDSS